VALDLDGDLLGFGWNCSSESSSASCSERGWLHTLPN
jgi:hypothetical protein